MSASRSAAYVVRHQLSPGQVEIIWAGSLITLVGDRGWPPRAALIHKRVARLMSSQGPRRRARPPTMAPGAPRTSHPHPRRTERSLAAAPPALRELSDPAKYTIDVSDRLGELTRHLEGRGRR